ncbi:MAG TPA: glucosamine-6-phosphate deaminase [Rhodothermales bacterium]|nr:glucosamine-6-phosphate deaminase [Rhodothermales bacterium]
MSVFADTLESSPATRPGRTASEGTQLERVPVLIFDEPRQMAYQVARRIATLIESHNAVGDPTVLGLPTGSTPIGVYQHLIRMHQEEGLDLSNVITFNIDEYFPMEPDSLQSYHRFMRENFFDHVNIPEDSIHIPRGDIASDEVESYCLAYEHAIEKAGGLDLILLGIGRSGHIGFNEPGSGPETRTRSIILDEITRKDAASDFFGDENVPREAITMGVGTILDANEIILMATGEHKAPIVRRAVEEEPNKDVTATYLQLHRNATFYVDRAAASALTREKTPWLVKSVQWDALMSKRAVIWLSEKLDKAILRLEASDFHRHHLHGLIHANPNIDDLLLSVFEDLRSRIVYKPGLPQQKRVIVFSPHPDDDVISMGGMLDKLVANGNEVTVAYMTNGSVAVFDADVRRYLGFVEMSHAAVGLDGEALAQFRTHRERVQTFLKEKDPGQVDLPEVQEIKAGIRYAEAVSGIEVMGLTGENARFLDLPFYKTGRVRKDPITDADVQIVLDLMNELEPHHIFVAGDLSDPHGTHRMCYVAIDQAVKKYHAQTGGDGKAERPLIWLYRGAWQEWEIHRADVFIPLSKADLSRKIEAIFKHESQKDRAMFPGAYDEREFWQRARDRNRDTAEALNNLGLPEFFAAEAYVTTYEM